eukprot:5075826-Pyramimonas_sp.AAC.1
MREQIIYVRGDKPKQLDYMLLNRKLFNHCANAEANNAADLGSDHKAVIIELKIPEAMVTQRPR